MLTRVAKVGALASVPQILDFLSRFFRTLILSRLLVPAEFGMAVAITVVLTIGELATDFGIGKYLISRPGEQDRQALAATHALLLIRGTVLAAILAAGAPAIAYLLRAPEHAATFRWCAVIILVRSLCNLEITQAKRDFHYAAEAVAVLSARFTALAVVLPAVQLFHDHRAMLASLMMDAVVYTMLSHWLAKTRYSFVAADRQTMRQAIAYGLPLTLNGLGIAANSQIDRALVSHWLGLEVLALYAAALNLGVIPVSLIAAIFGPLSMSVLARTHGSPELRSQSYLALVWAHAAVAAAFAVAVAASLDLLVPLAYGRQYMLTSDAHALIVMIVWVRINRGGPTALMLFGTDTRPLMVSNLVSATGLVLAALLLRFVPHLETVLACVLIGESLSLGFFVAGAQRRTIAPITVLLRHLLWSLLPTTVAAFAVVLFAANVWWWRAAILGFGTIVVGAQLLAGIRTHVLRGPLAPGTAVAGTSVRSSKA